MTFSVVDRFFKLEKMPDFFETKLMLVLVGSGS